MKPVLRYCGLLLRAVALLLRGSDDRSGRNDRVTGGEGLNLMKLRSWHVDPFRTGIYFPWTRRDD